MQVVIMNYVCSSKCIIIRASSHSCVLLLYTQQLSDAEQQKKALQLMQQATSSSAELEKEKNTSMRCELITLKDSLHALQDESSILEKELAKANTLNNKVR